MNVTKMLLSPCALLALVTIVTRTSHGWLMSSFTRSTRCYPPLGCFPTSRPFTNSAGFRPESPASVNVFYKLRRRGGVSTVFRQSNLNRRIRNTYVPSQKTVVLIHGYQENSTYSWMTFMADELLRKEPMNVILMDWSGGASTFVYFQSVANVRVVGALLERMLQSLVGLGASTSQFHIVGFSLGAHVAGQAGERLSGIGRITGLDPARPSFQGEHSRVRLDRGDARFVDVYHTDASRHTGLGSFQPMGDVDYYVNGGSNQPSCTSSVVSHLSSLSSVISTRRAPYTLVCSHVRARYVFTSTIMSTCSYPTYKCTSNTRLSRAQCRSCTRLGMSCPTYGYNTWSGSGIYRVETTGAYPYC